MEFAFCYLAAMDQRASEPLVRFSGNSARLPLAPISAVYSSSASSCPCSWWCSATGRSCWRCELYRGGWAHEAHDLWPQLKEAIQNLHFFWGGGVCRSARPQVSGGKPVSYWWLSAWWQATCCVGCRTESWRCWRPLPPLEWYHLPPV